MAHEIAIRREPGSPPQLYDRQAGRRSWPLGSDYVELTPQTDVSGHRIVHHGTLNVGRYQPMVPADQAEMARDR